jgi:uncharacterized membrane protein
MRYPFSPLRFLLFLLALAFLVVYVQVGLVTVTFHKLGLSTGSAFVLLLVSLFGSAINLPVTRIEAEAPPEEAPPFGFGWLPAPPFTGFTLIAVNVGGCIVPVSFSIYLLIHSSLSLLQTAVAVAAVAAASRLLSRPVPGVGIGMPLLVAPLVAALVAIVLGGEDSAPLAYISGTTGVLIGADLLRLDDIRKMGAPIASIGGAGTFDGIFLSGLVAVLLA